MKLVLLLVVLLAVIGSVAFMRTGRREREVERPPSEANEGVEREGDRDNPSHL
jgi:hypothetical protein